MSNSINLLVVDDEPFNLEIIKEYLEDDQYHIDTASDGEQALELLNADPGKYDVILLDRMMPGMDGIEVIAQLKSDSQFKHLPVVLQTAKATKEDIREGIDSGAFYYLTKPYDEAMLRTIVKSALEDVVRYQQLQEELESCHVGLSSMRNAQFEISDLDGVSSLTKVLANCYPEPTRVVTGISELLINAIEHGNLGITYAEKSELLLSDTWLDEVNRRLVLDENQHKSVSVDISLSDNVITLSITDQGGGFEWQKYLEMDPARAFDVHGRGIAMAKMLSFDEINYQGKGNSVEAVLYRKKS